MAGPLDLLEALARQEVTVAPGLRHVEVFTMRGLLTVLWHGDPDAPGGGRRSAAGRWAACSGPADGFYQWLGEELAAPGSGIGVLRVGWRRPNDIDLCTLDLLAVADLAARAGAAGFHHRRPQLRRGHRRAGRYGDGGLGQGGGHLRHAVGRLRGGRRGSRRRCSPSTATGTRSCRRWPARSCASWPAAPPSSSCARAPATC